MDITHSMSYLNPTHFEEQIFVTKMLKTKLQTDFYYKSSHPASNINYKILIQ